MALAPLVWLPSFFSSRRLHTLCLSDWSSALCSSALPPLRLTLLPGPGLSSAPRRVAVAGVTPSAPTPSATSTGAPRSEERRVGKERGALALPQQNRPQQKTQSGVEPSRWPPTYSVTK